MGSKERKVVGVFGATGFIGGALSERLEAAGLEVVRFSRRAEPGRAGWRGSEGALDLAGLDAVINLAGESVAQRWTSAVRERLRASRVGLTERLVDAIGTMPTSARPRCLLNASAVGYYGSRGDDELDEGEPTGEGCLAQLCVDWEAAAGGVEELGVRLVLLRTGVVLGAGGDAWERLWRVFRLGGGGALGDGRQWMPWIHLKDELRAIEFLLAREDLAGPFNLAAPGSVQNREFTKALARQARRPAIFRVPGAALKVALGGFGEALLESARVVPGRLVREDFEFQFADLESALGQLGGS